MKSHLQIFLLLLSLFGVLQTSQASPLPNGGLVSGSIATSGQQDSYTFVANAGDSVVLSLSGDIAMLMSLYAPDGSLTDTSANVIDRASLYQGGTYTVIVRSAYTGQTGNYVLYFAKAPGANEYGTLAVDDMRSGSITIGDLDSYTFTANTGDSVVLSLAGDIAMLMSLYAPDGSLTDTSANVIDRASLYQGGTYTVIVRSANAGQTGNYVLYYAKAPGSNEGGEIGAAGILPGTISPGDLDSYTLFVPPKSSPPFPHVTLYTSGNIDMAINLYNPDGSRAASGVNKIDQDTYFPPGGIFTVIVRSSVPQQAGDYQLTFNPCSVPGDVAPVSAPNCVINAGDVLVMARIILGLLTPSAQQLANGDLNHNNMIDLGDLVLLLKMIN